MEGLESKNIPESGDNCTHIFFWTKGTKGRREVIAKLQNSPGLIASRF